MTRCPCSSGLPLDECCAPLHRGERTAGTAEQLMRSRFSAYAVGDAAYLLRSWHPSTRPADLTIDDDVRWLRLDVLATSGGGAFDTTGTVEFAAHWRSPDGRGSMREVSSFTRGADGWQYVDGRLAPPG
ncbi:YchJ family protein [Cellulomonas sp. S1-8]|uniref:YchJ family protein n=1 Tax=Cellulomonas sp. S1-8 TaxID=2904790 RepID=UPI0022437F5C|nr:YchJ family metal-binding protein [Cellulomonas sp. S1-8]UZN03427.1 YchJ family metal-binding protein [Cellulomonas sp. S1-8]